MRFRVEQTFVWLDIGIRLDDDRIITTTDPRIFQIAQVTAGSLQTKVLAETGEKKRQGLNL
jgi:hypothetical protein